MTMTIAEACEMASKLTVEQWPLELIEGRWKCPKNGSEFSIFGEVFWIPLLIPLVEVLVASGLSSSKKRAREDITAGAVRIMGKKLTDIKHQIKISDLIEGSRDDWWVVISVSKFNRRIFQVGWPWDPPEQ